MRRYGTPDEFDRSAAFLLSPAASYLTGVMLSIDGGVRRPGIEAGGQPRGVGEVV